MSAIEDLKTLERDMSANRSPSPELVGQWVMILHYLIDQLSSDRCPECGGPMTYNQELQAHVCSHADEGD